MSVTVPGTKRVVVPVDGSKTSERAVPAGVALATRLDASLELLIARPPSDATRAAQYLEGIDVAGIEVVRQVDTNPIAAEVILGRAKDPTTLVCMATHGHTGLGELLFGSTAEGVLLAARRPIVLVGPHARPRDRLDDDLHILVCIDGTDMAQHALGMAALARSLEARVHLVAVTIVSDGIERDPLIDPARLDQVERLTTEFRGHGINADYEILSGHEIWPAVNAAADAHTAAFLGVVSQVRVGMARTLLGSEAITLVRHSHIPVIALGVPGAG